MLQKWQLITLKLKLDIEEEFEEPKLEKQPQTYSKFIEQKKKSIKNPVKNKNEIDLKKSQSFDDLIISEDNESLGDNNKSKMFEYDKIYEYINNNNKSDINNKIEISKSKSVDKFKNINFKLEKPKKWEYSYYMKKGEEKDIIRNKNKKKLMTDIERQQLFNNLYNDCKKRKEKYNKLKMEKEAKFNTLYTFTPKIFQNKLNEKYLKNLADSKFYTKSNSNIDNFQINNTNTTSSNNGIITKDKFEENKMENPLNFISRLSEYEKIKKKNLEKIKNEIYINYLGDKNKTKSKKSFDKIMNNHLLNTSDNYLELKQKNLERIKQNMDEEQGITFQPKTNKIFNNKIKNDILERNNEFIKEKQQRLEKYSNIKEKECTFKPKINNIVINTSKENSKNSNVKTEQNTFDVSKRLFDYQKKYKDNLEDMKTKFKENYTFKPIISKNTNYILNNKRKIEEKIDEKNIIINAEKKYNIENKTNELIKKKMKLEELEKLSKKLEELRNDNPEIKEECKEDININKNIKNNKMKRRKMNQNIMPKNDINQNYENSNKILELANNLINQNMQNQQNNFELNIKENTNDFGLLMNNEKRNTNSTTKRNFDLEYDFDSIKGNRQIMNLNYYDNLI